MAKPIIDIQLVCNSMPPNEDILNELKNIGYIHRETSTVPTSTYMRFDKGTPIVTHCLHLRKERSMDAIIYRDYLRSHENDRLEYCEVKKKLSETPNITMKEYRDGKQFIIDKIMDKAKKWYKEELNG